MEGTILSQKSNLKTKNHNLKLKTELKTRCYNYSLNIIRFLKSLPNDRLYWSIADQLLRSATSIGANIVEAKAASSKRDFIKFYQISLKSANETKYWLCLIRDSLKIEANLISSLLIEVSELANILAASLLTMKNKR